MAEICVDCFLKDFPEDKDRLIVDYKYLDLCEMCGEYKHCVIRVKPTFGERIYNWCYSFCHNHFYIALPFMLLLAPFILPVRFVQFLIRKYKKHKKNRSK